MMASFGVHLSPFALWVVGQGVANMGCTVWLHRVSRASPSYTYQQYIGYKQYQVPSKCYQVYEYIVLHASLITPVVLQLYCCCQHM